MTRFEAKLKWFLKLAEGRDSHFTTATMSELITTIASSFWEAGEFASHTLLAEKDAEIEKLRNSKQNLGVALGKMTVKFANSFDRAEEAEIKESTGALEIILLKNKLQAAEQKVAAMQAVLDAAKVIAKWMEFWLHEDLCECEDTHSCGKLERRAELLSYHDAVDAMEVSDEY